MTTILTSFLAAIAGTPLIELLAKHLLTLGAVLDALTTWYALSHFPGRLQEANPMLRGVMNVTTTALALIVGKALVILLTYWLTPIWQPILLALIVFQWWLVVNNARLILKVRAQT